MSVSSRCRCSHDVGVLTMSVSSRCRRSHDVGVLTMSAFSRCRCPHDVGVLTMSAFSRCRCPHDVGVLTMSVSSRCRRSHDVGVLTMSVSSRCRRSHDVGVLTMSVSSRCRCSHDVGVLTMSVSSRCRRSHDVGVLTMSVSSRCRCPHDVGVLTMSVSSRCRCPHDVGVLTMSAFSRCRRSHDVGVLMMSVFSRCRCSHDEVSYRTSGDRMDPRVSLPVGLLVFVLMGTSVTGQEEPVYLTTHDDWAFYKVLVSGPMTGTNVKSACTATGMDYPCYWSGPVGTDGCFNGWTSFTGTHWTSDCITYDHSPGIYCEAHRVLASKLCGIWDPQYCQPLDDIFVNYPGWQSDDSAWGVDYDNHTIALRGADYYNMYALCADADNCMNGSYHCDSDATCTNYPDGFICDCNSGCSGDGNTCTQDQVYLATHDNWAFYKVLSTGSMTNQNVHATCHGAGMDYPCYESGAAGCTGNWTSDCITYVGTGLVDCKTHWVLATLDDTFVYIPGWRNNYHFYYYDDAWGVNFDTHTHNLQGSLYDNMYSLCAVATTCAASPCGAHGTCTGGDEGYTCTCEIGWSGRHCADADNCEAGTHNCHTHATCTNSPDGYTCTCNAGYTGDGVTCTDHCDPNPCQNGGVCNNTGESYTCECAEGWGGPTCKTVVDGGWSNWVDGDCSVTCGEGEMTQTRTCTNPAPANGGAQCTREDGATGLAEDRTESCNQGACPIDGGWSEWVDGDCSVTCGEGEMTQTRTCTNPAPANGGAQCTRGDGTTGLTEDRTESCNQGACPIDGGWSEWVDGDCSVTCGEGEMTQTRTCTNPAPANGGAQCTREDGATGLTEDRTESCNQGACPIDGGWSEWVDGDCSVTCGEGEMTQTRTCTNPAPANGGAQCTRGDGTTGLAEDRTESCNQGACPIGITADLSDLTFSDIEMDRMTLSWTASADVTRYRLCYRHAGASYQDLSPPPAPGDTQATVRGLWADTEYNFTLTAFGEDDEQIGEISGTETTAEVIVNVECHQDHMSVTFPRAALIGVDVDTMHLLNDTCRATISETDPPVVTLRTGLQECGTTQENRSDIGETSRPLKVRYKEHCRPSANGYSSAIFHHLQHNQGHSFKLEPTDILDRERR
ncbi:hypothetical protein Bbelb_376290 [Branchiostoma belcheri]|nr:hypothetical protein Bbelb_376290 [Branchiostoma belcheri]